MQTTIVIPAYNEEQSIAQVIGGLKENNYHSIVVVNDGSKDTTAQKAEHAGATVISHHINRGQGAALQTGISHAVKDADIIITFDADGQHDPSELDKLTAPIRNREVDIVLGSRFLEDTHNAPKLREMFLKGGAFLFRRMYGVQVTDSHNGLRALSKRAAQKLAIKSDGMAHASEMVQQIGQMNLPYKEIPVTIKYTDYSMSRGQKNSAAFKILFKMLMQKLMK